MTNVYICPAIEDQKILETLPPLIESDSCHVLTPEELILEGEDKNLIENGIAACDVLVLVVESGSLSPTAARAHELARLWGKKVVGIWTSDNGPHAKPSAIQDYCHSWIPLDEVLVQDNVCGSNNDWVSTDGERLPAQPLKRHKCKPKRKREAA